MFFRSSLENDSREGLRLAITHNELAAKTEIRQGSCSPGPASYRTMPNLIGKVLVVWRGLGPVLSCATFSRERIRIKHGTPLFNLMRPYGRGIQIRR
jgi:hypothetical protein